MTKAEADQVIGACKKYHIFSTIMKIADNYSIRFENRIEFNSFEASKMVVNALVIENRGKRKKEEEKKESSDVSFLKSRYNFHKKKDTEPGKWGENRVKE